MMKKYACILLLVCIFSTEVFAQELSKVVLFSKTAGYRHKSIESGIESILKLGKENNFAVLATEDSDELVAALTDSKVIIFLSTTEDVLNDSQQEKFKAFIENGGGFVGIHAAADTEYGWPWYGKMVGAYFESHPEQQEARIQVVDCKHQATKFLKKEWFKFDEWYNYKNINPDIEVLLKLDESSYEGGKNGKNHPIAWAHEYEGGRVFYTGLGHTKESYVDPTFLQHLLGGIMYTMGK